MVNLIQIVYVDIITNSKLANSDCLEKNFF